MTDAVPDYDDLMRRFRRAFAKADATLFVDVLTDDFEWHTHTFPADDPVPTGTVLLGIEGIMGELARRSEAWADVRFDNLVERFSPGLVTQTFRISGVDEGVPFAVEVVDLYEVVDDRISRKSTYWKQPART